MAQDSGKPTACSQGPEARKQRLNTNLRAAFKRTIEIPNPKAFLMDYKKMMPRSTDKYVMKNVSMLNCPPKRRRGRPRKSANIVYVPKSVNSMKFRELVSSDEDDEFDLESLADPPLFSDDEEEELSAAVPNVTMTRSGRTIKLKKEDSTFKYYDMPGRHQLDTEDLSGQTDWMEETSPPQAKGKRGRKRKKLPDELDSTKKGDLDACDIHKIIKESFSLSTADQVVKDSDGSPGGSESLDEFAFQCFFCVKTFIYKEDCEAHMDEHLRKVVVDGSEINDETSDAFEDTETENTDNPGAESDVATSKDNVSNETGEDSTEPAVDRTSSSVITSVVVNGEKSFTCPQCEEEFDSQTALQEHTHDNIYECKLCGKKYQNRINLQWHVKRYHVETEWMKFKCATCGKSFGFLTALERHMKEHNPNQRFCCEQCGKVFKSLNNLKNHIPLHTKDEVFECPLCGKKYYIRYSFEKHMRTHIATPKFHCQMCDKSFTEKKHFETHLQRHQHGGNLGRSKDYRCNNCGDIKSPTEIDIVGETDPGHHKTCLECGKGLYKRFLIENVEPLPSQVKEVRQREQCKLCGKSVLNIQRHYKNSHLENYIPCDVCGVVVTKASLPAHKNRKHGGSAVKCDHCDRTFKNIMGLREHMAKVRRKEDPRKHVCKFCNEVVEVEFWKMHMAKHKSRCNDCGASNFESHEKFMAHLETCRRCSSCGLTNFTSRGEFLAHIEICGSSIDLMTGTLDTANDQEVVTSIFAIVDENACCETCGKMFEDQNSLAQHITEAHPSALSDMMEKAILYACPQESCEVIATNKELLKDHLASMHNVQIPDLDNLT